MTAQDRKGDSATAQLRLVPLLTYDDLEALLRLDRRTIARLCKQGSFPMPIKLGGSNRWRPADVAAALERRQSN